MLPRHLSVGSLTWVVASLVGTGCDRVFQLLEVTEGSAPDALVVDATADTPIATTCLADDFSAAINPAVWTIEDSAPNATVAANAGQLVYSLSQTTGIHYAQISTAPRDFTNDAFSIELITAINAGTDAEVGISVQSDSMNRYQLFVTGSSLLMRYSVAGENSDTFVGYSPAMHRFLRVRHAGTMLFWETSVDRQVWAVQRSASAIVDVTNVKARVFAGTYQLEPVSPGNPVVDHALLECAP